jgi:hypothetical protein
MRPRHEQLICSDKGAHYVMITGPGNVLLRRLAPCTNNKTIVYKCNHFPDSSNVVKYLHPGDPASDMESTSEAPTDQSIAGSPSRQVSISPNTFFWSNVFITAFLKLQFGFVIFFQKSIGAQAACKILMKLTTGVHSTKI